MHVHDCAKFRSEEHTSELQSRGLISYAVFCLKKKKQKTDATQIVSTVMSWSRCCRHSGERTSACVASLVLPSATVASLPSCSLFFFFNTGAPTDFSPFPPPAPFPI